MLNKNIFILWFFISFSAVLPQQNKISVDYNEIEGQLTKNDLMKIDFGRYDGFELPLNKDEYVYLFVYSSAFEPALILVDPNDKVYLHVKAGDEDFATIFAKVPQGGKWYVYVVGDTSSTGKYYFHYGFASPNSLDLKKLKDFCSSLNFLTEHSNAHFIFLQSTNSGNSLFKLPGALEVFIEDTDASYNSVMYDGNEKEDAEKLYADIKNNVRKCLSKKWQKDENIFKKIGDHKEKSVQFTTQTDGHEKSVQIIFADFTNTKERFYNDYAVVVVINSK